MTWTHRLRMATVARLPKAWQPAVSYHYYRARARLDRELPIICRALRPGTRAIDVGAHEGVYTHAFARTGATVESFEPQAACHAILRSYTERHPNVRVHPTALGAKAGTAMLRVPLRNGRPVTGWATLDDREQSCVEDVVEVRTLDSYAFENVTVLKVDVEGRELDVVRGARATIERWTPVLLVEIEERHLGGPEAMRRALDELSALAGGYRGTFVHPTKGVLPVSEFVPAQHQMRGNADVPGAVYVNNFIFTPLGVTTLAARAQ